MDILYFAYGSNLCFARLEARVPGSRFHGLGTLRGYDLRWHKRGQDGSGKCSVALSKSGAGVQGALFLIPASGKPGLDRVEGKGVGYNEIEVVVETASKPLSAVTYMATETHIDEGLMPFSWYRDLVVAGAEALGLPPAYIDSRLRVAARKDDDVIRDRDNRSALPCGSGDPQD